MVEADMHNPDPGNMLMAGHSHINGFGRNWPNSKQRQRLQKAIYGCVSFGLVEYEPALSSGGKKHQMRKCARKFQYLVFFFSSKLKPQNVGWRVIGPTKSTTAHKEIEESQPSPGDTQLEDFFSLRVSVSTVTCFMQQRCGEKQNRRTRRLVMKGINIL